ncbi:MAG: AsnC family transcriptional regulator [Rhodospirillales bacterium]|nr:AsnC family transcriptional regulator [Rhodospirillales bacterium]
MNAPARHIPPAGIDAADRRIVAATQAGLPLCPEPYRAVAEEVGLTEREVLARMKRLLARGAIRRIGAVPNHYALGFGANGMSVWDVADEAVGEAGRKVGALDFVTHCYRRPRRLPLWPYTLFAMVHGRSRDEVEEKVAEIATLLGAAERGHEVLYSTRILKKTGLRIAG